MSATRPQVVLFSSEAWGGRLATAALVEQNDAIETWIMDAAHDGADATAWPAVKHDDRLADRRPAFLVVEFVPT